ncbi:MAG: SHOCT domain-containing protein [Cytophagales bacterium]|nr:SHOCT domain-containing protein [Cytophagales bacterium]
MAGAIVGAGVGIYKNLKKKDQPPRTMLEQDKHPVDIHAELLKLDDLKQKGILTESEFSAQKKRILDKHT